MQTYKSVGRQGPAVNGSRPVAGRSGRKARVSVLSRSSAMNIRCEKVVGIDLGTTNSAVAAMEGGKPTIITNAEGGRTTPSVVAYTKTGDRLVGQIAKRQAVVNPENTFFSVKRFIGRKMEEVRDESKQVPYKLVEDGARNVKIRSSNTNKEFAPEEISAQVLRKLTADAAKFLNDKVEKAVITVPAYFNDSQRQATKDAGKIAGLEVLRIINEPTAASLAYGFDRKGNETILVFDLGGGTFDVSVLEVGDGVFEVLSTSGDTHLGGDDFDKRITDFLADDFQRTEGIDLRKDRQALQRLTEAAEKAKIELSALTQTSINLPFITATADGPKHIDTSLTRAKFEEMCSDLLRRCRVPVEQALKDAKLNVKDVQEIILVGGSTRIPAVQDIVRKISGRDPNVSVNPDEVVALGAAVQAGVLAGEVSDIVLLDVTPLSLGLETLGGVMTRLIPRNTTLPTSKSEVFSTAADGQTSVEVNVLQGEREFARDNKSLGTFRLDGIPPAARGVPQVEVKFDIDANGILSVTATDKGTGKKQDIKITGASTLGKDDVERMVKEAEKFAGEDKKRREAVDTKNQAESLVYQTEKQLKEFDDKLPADVNARQQQPGGGPQGGRPGGGQGCPSGQSLQPDSAAAVPAAAAVTHDSCGSDLLGGRSPSGSSSRTPPGPGTQPDPGPGAAQSLPSPQHLLILPSPQHQGDERHVAPRALHTTLLDAEAPSPCATAAAAGTHRTGSDQGPDHTRSDQGSNPARSDQRPDYTRSNQDLDQTRCDGLDLETDHPRHDLDLDADHARSAARPAPSTASGVSPAEGPAAPGAAPQPNTSTAAAPDTPHEAPPPGPATQGQGLPSADLAPPGGQQQGQAGEGEEQQGEGAAAAQGSPSPPGRGTEQQHIPPGVGGLRALAKLQVVHIMDPGCSTPLTQSLLNSLTSSWTSLHEIYFHGLVEVTDWSPLQRLPHLALCDLYSMRSHQPFTLPLTCLPPKVEMLGLQNVKVVDADKALTLRSSLKSLNLYHKALWSPRINGGVDMLSWLASCPALHTLTLELDMMAYARRLDLAPISRHHSPLHALRKLSPQLRRLELFFADSGQDTPTQLLDSRLIRDLACCTQLEQLELWNAYGDDWSPRTSVRPLGRLKQLRHLRMEAVPHGLASSVRSVMLSQVPHCRLRLVVDNEPMAGPDDFAPQG